MRVEDIIIIVMRHGYTRPAAGSGYSYHREKERLINRIRFRFEMGDGSVKEVEGRKGESLLDIAHGWDVDLEGILGIRMGK